MFTKEVQSWGIFAAKVHFLCKNSKKKKKGQKRTDKIQKKQKRVDKKERRIVEKQKIQIKEV